MPLRSTSPRRVSSLLLLALALSASPALARARHPRDAGPPPAPTPISAPLVTVAVEPETGALLPAVLPPSSAAERSAALRSFEGLREVRLAGGGVMVDLQGRFQEYAVVGIGPDGCLRLACVNDAPGLRAWWSGAPDPRFPWVPRPTPPELEVR
jgi:hypothetical protein